MTLMVEAHGFPVPTNYPARTGEDASVAAAAHRRFLAEGINSIAKATLGLGITTNDDGDVIITPPGKAANLRVNGFIGVNTDASVEVHAYDATAAVAIRSESGAAKFSEVQLHNSVIDWNIQNQGSGDLRIRDATNGKNIVGIEQGAPDNTLYLDSSGNVGIRTASPDGPFHVRNGDASSSTPATNADTVIIEDSGAGGLTFVAPTDQSTRMNFADPGGSAPGQIRYNHLDDTMYFAAGNSTSLVLKDASIALVDGVSAPSTFAGFALLYVDSADGDLKIKFGDGTVKTIATDT